MKRFNNFKDNLVNNKKRKKTFDWIDRLSDLIIGSIIKDIETKLNDNNLSEI